jgi:type IV pilus assembly protein PilB
LISRKRLGDILLEKKVITEDNLKKSLDYQQINGGRIGTILVALGLLSEDDILKVLSDQFNIAIVNINNVYIDEKVFNLFNENFLRENMCIPFSIDGDILNVLVSDPTNILIRDVIKKTVGLESRFLLTTERSIDKTIDDFFLENKVLDNFKEDYLVKNNEENLEYEEENTSVIIDIVNTMLKEAIKEKASDIHVGVVNEKVYIRFRLDGILIKYKEYPIKSYKNLVSRLKTIAGLNVTDSRGFQNGRITRNVGDQHVDMRVSTLPTIYGEKIVIRLLDKGNLFPSVDELGFNEKSKKMYSDLIKYPYGMILITGPTGSGKSSTLYTTINELFDVSKNIITVEDPVEYKLNGIEQVQVNERAGITFSAGLRAILRQDPDIIMVGEIRDTDTAQISTTAALTGHLVFSTLHTNDAVSSVSRLVDMGVEPYLVASTVMGVINQRLVRKLCNHCKVEVEFDGNVVDEAFFGIEQNEKPFKVCKAIGCERCKNTGYSGRIALHEMLVVDDTVRRLIVERAPDVDIRNSSKGKNLVLLKEDAMIKIKQGLTSIEEVKRHIL